MVLQDCEDSLGIAKRRGLLGLLAGNGGSNSRNLIGLFDQVSGAFV